ncbi:tetratricopeptide repeat protein [Streptomyces sp. NPDC050504]|uniref:tetratricopeptide repeat protein n=1 Tax=Streptomyces sp. NPDC050504 TaxID=3365618 RepID=UPI00379EADEF
MTDPHRATAHAPRKARAALVALLALLLTAAGIALGRTDARPAGPPPAPTALGPPATSTTALRAHLKKQPKDDRAWAALGAAHVEQARTTGDPTRYRPAEAAFARSLALRPRDNAPALAGRAALAAARHDFRAALRDARAALAINPYSEQGLAVRVDALVELGRYDEALKAARTADAHRPGIPAFTRLAYVYELRGDTAAARRALDLAASTATAPGDRAYVATALAQLALNTGDFTTALRHCEAALAADPLHLPALETRARTQLAAGDVESATEGMERVVNRLPLPAQLATLGELYEAAGRTAQARAQYRLIGAWTAVARANGVDTDLETALAEADHGDRAEALRAARAEWAERRTVHTADALAWALHVNGHDAQALPYARRAAATGYVNPVFRHHLTVIRAAVERGAPTGTTAERGVR